MGHRGALLGPEESGPANRNLVSGGWDCFFWVTDTLDLCGSWVCLVAGAGSHQTSGVEGSVGVLFPCGMFFYRVVVVRGWCSCPYFENCIVDASIFVVFCCVTSY